MFVIEDEIHAELQEGEFQTLTEAISELERRAAIPWNVAPNRAPCASWQTCGRTYEIIEYDTSCDPWKEVQRILFLEITAAGVKWLRPVVEKR